MVMNQKKTSQSGKSVPRSSVCVRNVTQRRFHQESRSSGAQEVTGFTFLPPAVLFCTYLLNERVEEWVNSLLATLFHWHVIWVKMLHQVFIIKSITQADVVLSMTTAFHNDSIRAGVFLSLTPYTQSGSNFLLIHHWGYTVLGVITHLAVKASLSDMHTRVVHEVLGPVSNCERMALFSTETLLFQLHKESSVPVTTVQQGRGLLSVVASGLIKWDKAGMSQWPWHRPSGC